MLYSGVYYINLNISFKKHVKVFISQTIDSFIFIEEMMLTLTHDLPWLVWSDLSRNWGEIRELKIVWKIKIIIYISYLTLSGRDFLAKCHLAAGVTSSGNIFLYDFPAILNRIVIECFRYELLNRIVSSVLPDQWSWP